MCLEIELLELFSVQSKILCSLFSHNFINTDLSCNTFKDVLERIDAFVDKIVFNEEIMHKKEFKFFTK